LFAVLALAGGYAWLARNGLPRPGGAVGLGLGIVGLLLMLHAEFAYSLRKRLPRFNVGPMCVWLEWHIFSGMVGAFLVLLHSGGRSQGVAGITLGLTLTIILSGLIGRFAYTALPRSTSGEELTVQELEAHINHLDDQLSVWGASLLGEQTLAEALRVPPGGWLLLVARPWLRWRHARKLRRAARQLATADRARVQRLQSLLTERYRLLLQIRALPFARRLLALWYFAHVPLGIVLFTLAFVHVLGALYYTFGKG